jgi:glycine cleavage system H protein
MNFPDDLKYSRSHEWVRLENGGEVTVGISDYAQDQMGDIVFVELPEEGDEIEKEAAFGVIESVKATEDIYAPVSGRVLETNDPLEDSPEVINEDCYGDGWLIRVELFDPGELDDLMDPQAYQEFVKEESE